MSQSGILHRRRIPYTVICRQLWLHKISVCLQAEAVSLRLLRHNSAEKTPWLAPCLPYRADWWVSSLSRPTVYVFIRHWEFVGPTPYASTDIIGWRGWQVGCKAVWEWEKERDINSCRGPGGIRISCPFHSPSLSLLSASNEEAELRNQLPARKHWTQQSLPHKHCFNYHLQFLPKRSIQRLWIISKAIFAFHHKTSPFSIQLSFSQHPNRLPAPFLPWYFIIAHHAHVSTNRKPCAHVSSLLYESRSLCL